MSVSYNMGKVSGVRAFLCFLILSTAHRTVLSQSLTVAEQYLLSAVNRERSQHGLSAVHADTALSLAARNHALVMVDHRSISHRFDGEPDLSTRGSVAGAHFDRITENVAEGPSIVVLHEAWMKSAGHRANILDPDVDAIGLAVLEARGQFYAVEDFESTVPELSLVQQEGAVASLLDGAGVELVPDANARKTCAMTSGYAGDRRPAFIVRYTTGDISTLPSQLKQRLALAQDHQASVGACIAQGGDTFSKYSIAVLLFQ